MTANARLFVGRERERAEIGAALGRAAAGQGALVLLTGEPGIGKTRLGDEAVGRRAWARLRRGVGAMLAGGGRAGVSPVDPGAGRR